MPILWTSLRRPPAEPPLDASEFHLAYRAHLELGAAAAAAGLHDDALAALRFAIECFFKSAYRLVIDMTYDSAIWNADLKPYLLPPVPSKFSHDLAALIRVLEAMTDLRQVAGFSDLWNVIPSLPLVESRYARRQHSAAKPKYELVSKFFEEFLEKGSSHLR